MTNNQTSGQVTFTTAQLDQIAVQLVNDRGTHGVLDRKFEELRIFDHPRSSLHKKQMLRILVCKQAWITASCARPRRRGYLRSGSHVQTERSAGSSRNSFASERPCLLCWAVDEFTKFVTISTASSGFLDWNTEMTASFTESSRHAICRKPSGELRQLQINLLRLSPP